MANDLPGSAGLNPNAVAPADLVKLIKHVGGWPITPEMIERDVAAGAPTHVDGKLSLLHYAAWLVKEMHHADD